jgi:valyl-tRNA synthetase
MSHEMPKAYDPHGVEQRTYERWLAEGAFNAEVNPGRPPFCIVIPPPNVTGVLHMGHALDETIQDLLTRWKRMSGFEALWVPGTDHAGIATQNVVERLLAQEGTDRHQLGREAFVKRTWAVKEQHHGVITGQLKRLGCSVDWRRERFTLDETCARAVREAFVTLHEQGLIYRGDYMINWCPRCQTGLSDLEVDDRQTRGHLWLIRYPSVDGEPGVVVATTRPETMLGDTAVAVHPDDPRYRHLVGTFVRLPLMEREIPVVADAQVDPQFGTGAVKVTPAHDPNDLQIAGRHSLPSVAVIGSDGTMTVQAGAYAGMDRTDCRRQVVSDLDELGLLERIDTHEHVLPECSRCGTIVEPLVSTQWFLRMGPLAEEGLEAVRGGKVSFVPERWSKVYCDWLEAIRDWPISRQLWWGHAIPAWHCADCGETTVTREDPTACAHCQGARIERDPDVLDTWFSSALWPLSTLGWPEETPELGYFYPTTVLVTGYDIIFFWVARMVMFGCHLRGEAPFREVFIHGLVRDETGRKMSKSIGNAVDPIELIEQFGADPLRFALVQLITHGQDLTYSPDRIVGARNFCNKLWNASRFVLMNLEGAEAGAEAPRAEDLSLADRWILSRHAAMLELVDRQLSAYNLAQAADALYEYVWSEFCDWYVELAKNALYGEDAVRRAATQAILRRLLSEILRALHPFMPFITEEIWRQLAPDSGGIALAAYPRAREGEPSPEAEAMMATVQAVTVGIRQLRADLNVAPGHRVDVLVVAPDEATAALLSSQRDGIRSLGTVGQMEVAASLAEPPANTVTTIAAGCRVFLSLTSAIDIPAEIERLGKRLDKLREDEQRSRQKLTNESFTARAPEEVVARERGRLLDTEADIAKLEDQLRSLEAME